ncbi:MAG: hypothetical protein HYU51_00655 [Candidatus Rokubacteria bacterium]|nr:hypothetical protein [Candidatus Rokubacteria bacterium]
MGAASGRIDALVFMAGIVAGVWAFAETWVALAGFVASGELESLTFADLLGVPFWVLAVAVVVIALATFWGIGKLENRESSSDNRPPGRSIVARTGEEPQ